jgi:hypothetical protein
MSTYRKAPTRTSTTIVVERGLGFTAGMTVAFLGAALLVGHLTHGVAIECSRAAGSCSISTVYSPGIRVHRDRVQLATIERAVLHDRVSGGEVLHAIALVRDGRTEPLTLYADVEIEERRAFVEQVDAFLRETSEPELHAVHVSPWPFVLWIAAAVLFGGSQVQAHRKRTRIVVDRDRRALVVDRDRHGERVTIALGAVVRAEVEEDAVDDRTVHGVVIVRSDGPPVGVTARSDGPVAAMERLVERINEALVDR